METQQNSAKHTNGQFELVSDRKVIHIASFEKMQSKEGTPLGPKSDPSRQFIRWCDLDQVASIAVPLLPDPGPLPVAFCTVICDLFRHHAPVHIFLPVF